MFGRADAPASDLAFFKANRLDPDSGRIARRIRWSMRTPAQPDLLDRRHVPESHLQPVAVSQRIGASLAGGAERDGFDFGSDQCPIPEPARCLLAIQEARTALCSQPRRLDRVPQAQGRLSLLMLQESAMLAGIPITPENRDRIASVLSRARHAS